MIVFFGIFIAILVVLGVIGISVEGRNRGSVLLALLGISGLLWLSVG